MYTPKPGEEGTGVIKGALRDFLAADLSAYGLPSIVDILPGQGDSIIDEGFLAPTTPTPVIMITTGGDGKLDGLPHGSLCRFIIYAIDAGRGHSRIERLLYRMRRRFNVVADHEHPHHEALFNERFLLSNDVDFRIEGVEAPGSTFSASLPAWRGENRALYVFVTATGLSV